MSFPKKIIREVTPPVVHKLFRHAYPAKNVKVEKRTTYKIEDIGPKMMSLCFDVPLFSIPVEKLRYHGGLAYNEEQHHFLKYYKEGKKALIDFYNTHQPKNVFEQHYLTPPDDYVSKYSATQIKMAKDIIPWLFDVNDITFSGEKGLGNEHGHQAYGPVSDEKLNLEIARLDEVLHSIKKNGYNPLQFSGYTRGYFLMDKEHNWTFLVRTGFHRVAALIHLGWKRIPFEFQKDHPRIICETDCEEWGSVKKGYLANEEAVAIFRTYVP